MRLARPIMWIESKKSGEMNTSEKEMKKENYTMSMENRRRRWNLEIVVNSDVWEMTQTRLS